jgi:hypothetical protein
MKKNYLVSAMLFLGAGIILLAVSKANVTPKFADFAFGACFPMFLGAIIALFKHFRATRVQA